MTELQTPHTLKSSPPFFPLRRENHDWTVRLQLEHANYSWTVRNYSWTAQSQMDRATGWPELSGPAVRCSGLPTSITCEEGDILPLSARSNVIDSYLSS